MDSGQNPVEPCFGVYLVGHKPFTLTYITRPTRKSESQRVILEYFIPESIVPNIVKCFFDVKKSSYYVFSSVEAFHVWDSLNRWSSVDLALLKPD